MGYDYEIAIVDDGTSAVGDRAAAVLERIQRVPFGGCSAVELFASPLPGNAVESRRAAGETSLAAEQVAGLLTRLDDRHAIRMRARVEREDAQGRPRPFASIEILVSGNEVQHREASFHSRIVLNAGDERTYATTNVIDDEVARRAMVTGLANVRRLNAELVAVLELGATDAWGIAPVERARPPSGSHAFHHDPAGFARDLDQLGIPGRVVTRDMVLEAVATAEEMDLDEVAGGLLVYSRRGTTRFLGPFYRRLDELTRAA